MKFSSFRYTFTECSFLSLNYVRICLSFWRSPIGSSNFKLCHEDTGSKRTGQALEEVAWEFWKMLMLCLAELHWFSNSEGVKLSPVPSLSPFSQESGACLPVRISITSEHPFPWPDPITFPSPASVRQVDMQPASPGGATSVCGRRAVKVLPPWWPVLWWLGRKRTLHSYPVLPSTLPQLSIWLKIYKIFED